MVRIQFANEFSDFGIVTTLSSQLSWSHFIELFRLKSEEAKAFYAKNEGRRKTIGNNTTMKLFRDKKIRTHWDEKK